MISNGLEPPILGKVVDDMVNELDRLLDGRISKDNWAHTDQMKLIYPPGAKFDAQPNGETQKR